MSAEELEARRKVLKPSVSVEIAVGLAMKAWGLHAVEGEARQLDSYDDNNFYMPGTLPGDAGPCKYLLKVHNGVESANGSVLDYQDQMMAAIQRGGINCPVPVHLRNDSGSYVYHETLPVRGSDGTASLAVRLLKWVEGTPLVEMPCTAQALVNAGAYLGKLNRVLDGFDHPAAHRHHMWDPQRIRSLTQFMPCIPDPARRALVQLILEAFETDVFPICESFRYGVIMSDYNDANIIVDPTDVERIVGVIDIGDSMASWRVNDVAIAMAYAAVSAFGKSMPIQACACILKGFVQEYPLTNVEKQHLLTLACGRLAISVTLGAYSYQKDPSNKYLLIHSQPAWNALHTLWYSDRGSVLALFDRAVEGAPISELLSASFPVLTEAPSFNGHAMGSEGSAV